MRKSIIIILLTVAALALPIVDATAATRAATKKIVVSKRFTGSLASVQQWGSLQVTIVVRKTTTISGTKKKVTRRLTAVSVPTYPNHTNRSVYINRTALPILKAEALRAQSANVNMVSGATDSSDAFAQSLQSAILKAKQA
ncbi:MAG: FMN-binding protein [Actinobacteria bacterium]|nr:MAG: FMN-binding protein [Actinomycetota bacterium]